MTKEKRFSYSTPKSFLELLKLYTGMLGGKVDALEDKKERLTNGLEKLEVTKEQVAALEEVLTEKAEVVKVKVAEAEVKAEEVGAEKAKVSHETEKANVVAEEAEEISKKVNIQKASCEKDPRPARTGRGSSPGAGALTGPRTGRASAPVTL